MKRFVILLFSAAMFIPGALYASCGAASCPLNHHRYLRAGSFHIGFSREYINQDKIFIGGSPSFVGAIGGHHDEVQTINERSVFQLQVGVSNRLGFALDVPFIARQHSHIHHHQGEDIWEYWNFKGFGDVLASAQFAVLLPESDFEPYLSVQAGLKLPSGVTNIKNADGDEAEVTIQPGSGSTDFVLGFNYRQTITSIPTLSGDFSALPISAGATYQANGKGSYDWRFGNTLLAHIGTEYQFSTHASLLLQINGRKQEYSDVGTTREPGENTGGTWVYVSPGLKLDLSDAISAYGYVQLPVYQNVNGIQQTSAFNLQFGISANVNMLN
ncbi:MAG: hypothetical protein L0287_26220 [Anaerolineae bacterium]|nr:hypothetical protein [Anaerolineae bacterium]MCI0708386.1 hypothetical protein [Ignavibacteriota bacterium]